MSAESVMHSVPARSISLTAAQALETAALAFACRRGWAVAVAVVDPSGISVVTCRMDGVSPPIMTYALDKAYTAATTKTPTKAFYERMSAQPELAMGLTNRARLLTWEGGLPIFEDGCLIGGLGISGAAGHEDGECAAHALATLGLSI